MTGAERIAKERQRQIDAEGWTPEHDDEHQSAEMAMAAICYAACAAGEPVYAKDDFAASIEFKDPWPWWRVAWWRRHEIKDGASHREISRGELPGLTDRWFPTRFSAMRAAERVFVPILRIVDEIVDVDVKITVKGAFK